MSKYSIKSAEGLLYYLVCTVGEGLTMIVQGYCQSSQTFTWNQTTNVIIMAHSSPAGTILTLWLLVACLVKAIPARITSTKHANNSQRDKSQQQVRTNRKKTPKQNKKTAMLNFLLTAIQCPTCVMSRLSASSLTLDCH